MVDFVIFNELSLPCQSSESAELSFINLFKLLRGLKDNSISKVRTDEPTKNWEIIPKVFFPQYLNQLKNKELKTRLQTFLNNNEVVKFESPLISEGEETEELLSPVYKYNDKETFGGLACASYWDALAVSIYSEEEWNQHKVNLLKDNLAIEIRHASKAEHLDEHQEYFSFLENERKLAITQRNFWRQKEQLFTKFVFIDKVENEIKKLDAQVFKQLVSILRSIETGRKTLSELNITGESAPTNNNQNCVRLRTFIYRGENRYFERHIKNFHSGYRLHFIEDGEKIIVGYIGPHLSTSSDK